MTSLIAFDDLTIEALTEAAQEAFEEVTWSLERTLKQATNFGRILSSVRKKIPHGQWVPWVESTFGDTISLRKIQRYMQIANASDQTLLEGAQTIDEALMRIAEPKRERNPSVEVVEPIEVTAKEPTPEKTQGETATNAVHREETRKAPAHRPPEKFTPVTPSYVDEEPEAVPMRLESGFDEVEATERIRSLIHKEMARWPADRHAEAIQVFQLYLGSFDNE
jgi:hypothetical protein